MKFLLVALLLVVGIVPAFAQTTETTSRLIVRFKDAGVKARPLPTQQVVELAGATGVPLAHERVMALGAHLVALPSRVSQADARVLAARLAADPRVAFAQPDGRRHALLVPNDSLMDALGYLQNTPGGISAIAAWDTTTGTQDTVVAVLDTGYRPHFELAGRLLPGYDFVSNPQIANDGDGRDADATDPGDWISAGDRNLPGFGDCDVHKSSWHGTEVAGVIAANANNGRLIAGINWAARILPVRVLGKCGGYDSDIIDAVAWAGGLAVPGAPVNPNPAQIINLSLGGSGPCDAGYRAVFSGVLAHGVTRAVVVAAGNEGEDVAGHSPANCPEVLAVASTTTTGRLAYYSNFGPGIALSAPGGSFGATDGSTGITVITNYGFTTPTSDGFRAVGGTSFAAPMVAGVASLALALAPDLGAAELRSLLVSTVKPFPAGSDCSAARCGAGIVDAMAVVAAATSTSPVGQPAPAEGLWWNAPAGSESGWGINFEQQGDTIFATWFTYDGTGKPWWLIAVLQRSSADSNAFTGEVSTVTGPAFGKPWNSAAVADTPVGTMTVTFTGADSAVLAYTVNGINGTKSIERQVFAAVPTCVWGATRDLRTATNYQGLWWNSPAESESGWGINFTHQGNIIFATWFTYDGAGQPWWLLALLNETGAGAYAGTIWTMRGPAFNAPWNAAQVVETVVGSATLSFANGNAATFAYTVNGLSETKDITREVFAPPGTVCHF